MSLGKKYIVKGKMIEQFTMIPNYIFLIKTEEGTLPARALMYFIRLWNYPVWKKPNREEFAKEFNVSTRTITNWNQVLRTLGLLKIVKTKTRQGTHNYSYHLAESLPKEAESLMTEYHKQRIAKEKEESEELDKMVDYEKEELTHAMIPWGENAKDKYSITLQGLGSKS